MTIAPVTGPTAGIRGRDLLPFQIVMGVTSAGVGGIIAVLGELQSELGFSRTAAGVIVAAGFLASFVAQVTLASYADRGHARPMVVAGVIVAVVALLVMIGASEVISWVTARALFGFAGGLIMPGVRRAAAVADPARVGENMGRLAVGEISGFLVGPIVAGILVEVGGIRLPFVVFAVAMALFVPFALRLPPDRGRIDTAGRRLALDLLPIRQLQGALVLIGAYFIMIGAFEAVIPLMYHDRGASPLATGIAFSTFAIPIVALSPWAGRVADRVGATRVATIGIGVVVATSALYGVLPGYLLPASLMLVAGVADAFGFTAVQAAVAGSVPEERQAAALGLMGATEVLAAGVAAIPAAVAYERWGAGPMWLATSGVTIVLIAVAVTLFRRDARGRG